MYERLNIQYTPRISTCVFDWLVSFIYKYIQYKYIHQVVNQNVMERSSCDFKQYITSNLSGAAIIMLS